MLSPRLEKSAGKFDYSRDSMCLHQKLPFKIVANSGMFCFGFSRRTKQLNISHMPMPPNTATRWRFTTNLPCLFLMTVIPDLAAERATMSNAQEKVVALENFWIVSKILEMRLLHLTTGLTSSSPARKIALRLLKPSSLKMRKAWSTTKSSGRSKSWVMDQMRRLAVWSLVVDR